MAQGVSFLALPRVRDFPSQILHTAVFLAAKQTTFMSLARRVMSLALNRQDGKMECNPMVVALRREKNLLEQVLCLAICQFDLVQAGRMEDLEVSLLVRAQKMRDLAITEANINAKMPDIENDPTISSTELEELHYLNLQITKLTDSIVDIDEKAQQFVELADSGASPESLNRA
jgi:hypothetical protein